MRTVLVYDLPTRLFHWFFAGLFISAFVIAKTIDDESLLFTFHMLAGIQLGGLVLWRIIWGFLGSKYSRFSGFHLNPIELKKYFAAILSGSHQRWAGHNPASSWAAFLMLGLGLGLAITGYLMTTGQKEAFEDVHEFLANTFVLTALFHIAGVLIHTLRHKDFIALSMFDGKKDLADNSHGITNSRPFAGLILLALLSISVLFLFKNFDPTTRTLQAFGLTLQLGENETEESEYDHSENKENKNEDKDDDKNDD